VRGKIQTERYTKMTITRGIDWKFDPTFSAVFAEVREARMQME
jgi:hypothetical protein